MFEVSVSYIVRLWKEREKNKDRSYLYFKDLFSEERLF